MYSLRNHYILEQDNHLYAIHLLYQIIFRSKAFFMKKHLIPTDQQVTTQDYVTVLQDHAPIIQQTVKRFRQLPLLKLCIILFLHGIACLHATDEINIEPEVAQIVSIIQSNQKRIEQAQHQALVIASQAFILRNWYIGKTITEMSAQQAWGSGFIQKLSDSLQAQYSKTHGYSLSNIYRMVTFYQMYKDVFKTAEELQDHQISMIPWNHNTFIVEKAHTIDEALWYINQVYENKWSRAVLEDHMNKNMYYQNSTASIHINPINDPENAL